MEMYIEKIYDEETAKYNFYVNNKEVDFIEFYKTLKNEYFKELDNKEKDSEYKTNFCINAMRFQNLYNDIKTYKIDYAYGDYTFRIEEK